MAQSNLPLLKCRMMWGPNLNSIPAWGKKKEEQRRRNSSCSKWKQLVGSQSCIPHPEEKKLGACVGSDYKCKVMNPLNSNEPASRVAAFQDSSEG